MDNIDMNSPEYFESLKKYATGPQQKAYLEALKQTGGHKAKASELLGTNHRNNMNKLSMLKSRAALQGYAPEHDVDHPVPDTHINTGNSTLYKDGEQVLQWVKTSVKHDHIVKVMRGIVDAMKEDIPRAVPIEPPKLTSSELLNLYTITDYHLGMLSWPEETGADWNTEVAEDLLMKWFESAIALAPDSENAVFAQLGDFLHWDGMEAVTPASKHVLDADTRFQHIVRVAIRVIRRVVQTLLTKHQNLHIIMADANHDPASGVWLRELLSAMYEDEPRVTVDNSADSYYCYEHGLVSLFFHHGHKKKPNNIHDVFAAKFREVFGRTKYSYAHMGHMHSVDVKETNLMIVEQHRTLAAPDAYSTRGGWISGRDAKVVTYHKKYGKVASNTITPEMVQ